MSETVEIPTTHILVATIYFDVKEELQTGYWKYTIEGSIHPDEMVSDYGLQLLAVTQEVTKKAFESKGWGDKVIHWEVIQLDG